MKRILILTTVFMLLSFTASVTSSTLNNPQARTTFRSGERPGMLSVTHRMVVDEALIDGRYVIRYWNPNGQIWPEMHYSNFKWAVDDPGDSFRLSINGKDLSGGYRWVKAELTPDPSNWQVRTNADGTPIPVTHSVVTLENKDSGIRVNVHTRLDGSPFMIRWLEITNLNKKAVAITEVAPFSGILWTHPYEDHLPKQFKTPFEVAYNHSFDWGHEGDFYFEDLTPGKLKVDGEKKGRSGWGRPAFWARNRCNGQTFVCELAWGGNYEFAFDCKIDKEKQSSLFFKMGLSGWDEALRVLDAGETITTPSVHMALFQNNDDEIVQATHDHVRHVVMPKQIPDRHVELEANHRGYLCDRENVADIIKDIDVAKSMGTDLYVIDAGWYGNAPNQWYNNQGDWFEGPWMKKGGGLKAISDYVHKQNMKFGLWIEIECAGKSSDLRKNHPDWLMTRNGIPVANSRALNLTNPVVWKFEKETISRFIKELKLDMYRIDHNHNMSPSGNRQYQGFTEDLMWRYYDNLYRMFDELRSEHPDVVFQNCASGGGRLDWGTMARFHNAELSDHMRLPRGFKILNGVSMSLPPEILMRAFGTEANKQVLDGDVDTQLRHNFCRMIIRGIAPSLPDISPYLKERVENYTKIHKEIIVPTMIDGKVFHHTPMLPVMGDDPWCVLEYAKPDKSVSVAVVMRTTSKPEGITPDEYRFYPRGINPAKEYIVTLDSDKSSWSASGNRLINEGIRIRREVALTSELIILQAK